MCLIYILNHLIHHSFLYLEEIAKKIGFEDKTFREPHLEGFSRAFDLIWEIVSNVSNDKTESNMLCKSKFLGLGNCLVVARMATRYNFKEVRAINIKEESHEKGMKLFKHLERPLMLNSTVTIQCAKVYNIFFFFFYSYF